MSEKKFPPAELRFLFLAGGTAFVVTAVCLAAMAAWMVAQKCPGTAAEPLAAAAVGVGSFCGGWVAAFCKKRARADLRACAGRVLCRTALCAQYPIRSYRRKWCTDALCNRDLVRQHRRLSWYEEP